MPGLIVFQRRWTIGSDDLVFPALIELLINSLCLGTISTLFLIHKKEFTCDGPQHLHKYIIALQILLVMSIVLNAMIAYISAQGTISQTRPRRNLPFFLYARLLLGIPQIVLNGFGSKWAFTPEDHICESALVVTLIKVIAIGAWLHLTFIIGGIIIVFDPLGAIKKYGSKIGDVEHNEPQALYINLNSAGTEKSKKIWEFRMKLLCCCTNIGPNEHNENAFAEIGKLFASYFQDVDLVPSDVAAGLILLHEKYSTERISRTSTSQQSESYSAQSPDSLTSTGGIQGSIISSPGVFTPPAQHFWMTTDMACHFMKYAYASYGWPLFMYANCCTGFCKIWRNLRCIACCRQSQPYIMNDNCCHCHTATVKTITGLTDDDFVYISYHNRIYEVPFYVAVDHQTCSVVVAIRGTLSFQDALTDLTAEHEVLYEDNKLPGILCHKGMLWAANYVKKKLEETNALNDALALHQSYSLVITGHSLGAGTAAVLAFLLRPVYPTLKCIAFSPPGGLLNTEGAKYSEDFILSVVVGDDLVPRLSVPTMEDLKRRLLNCIIESEQPKYRTLLRGICPKHFSSSSPDSETTSRLSSSRPLLPESISTGNYHSASSKENDSSIKANVSSPCKLVLVPLFLPGRILYLSDINGSYRARWVSAEYFNQIVVSPNMIHHHMPEVVYKSLLQVTHSNGQFSP